MLVNDDAKNMRNTVNEYLLPQAVLEASVTRLAKFFKEEFTCS